MTNSRILFRYTAISVELCRWKSSSRFAPRDDIYQKLLDASEILIMKRTVKANISRFPSDFMFELTKEEFEVLRCRKFTSKSRGGTRYLPYAFTQEGVVMLSGLLRSEVAIKANIHIMRAFVKMRTTLASVERLSMDIEDMRHQISELNHYMEGILKDQNDINEETMMQLQLINESLAEMRSDRIDSITRRKKIGFKTHAD